jgi:hypothetical protein|eukprot:COSAG01_NODE_424_length_17253_cov_31.601900_23_plen_71_part_00
MGNPAMAWGIVTSRHGVPSVKTGRTDDEFWHTWLEEPGVADLEGCVACDGLPRAGGRGLVPEPVAKLVLL